MSLRFLILNTDYPEFLGWLYAQQPGLEEQPYHEQMRARNESLFGVADFYSKNLRKLGHEAFDIHANNGFMQKAWAKENGVRVKEPSYLERILQGAIRQARRGASLAPVRYFKPLLRLFSAPSSNQQAWFYEILAAQIKYHKPDVLLNQTMNDIGTGFLRGVKPHVRLLVGQHAATPLPDSEEWGYYDLVISSSQPTVRWFQARGVPAQFNGLGFEPKVLSCLKRDGRVFDATFIGSLFGVHSSRIELLENLCARFSQMRIWGPGVEHLPADSPIRKCYVEQAWGREMYQILHASKVTLNHHGDVGPYANNMRLFEATGVETLLVTDWKVNLHEIFELGKEVVAYRSPEECVELVQYYLEHDKEREAIARAGQERTLREHTYYHRMQELAEIVSRYL